MADDGQKTLLIIEDDPSTAELFTLIAERGGYAVQTAADGQVALDLLIHDASCRPDLIILDIMLPKKDGIEILRELKKEGRKVPVLAVTAALLKDDLAKAVESSPNVKGTLKKPIEPKAFLAKIKEVLAGA